jgi:2-oxoglutarate dehydrogenase E2 component (dihydrolipoamide succinyltransferase)
MKVDVKAPSVGESITEVSILKWNKKSGQRVKVGEQILEIESDKATVEVVAEANGVLTTLKNEGDRILIGAVIGVIDDAGKETVGATATAPAPAAARPTPAPSVSNNGAAPAAFTPGPAARKAIADSGIDASQISGSGKDGRVTKGDVLTARTAPAAQAPAPTSVPAAAPMQLGPGDRRVPMSMLRARIAERLVQAQHTAAILTTFNEVDMSAINKIRSQYKESFKAKNGVALSFMSFFTKASVEALKLIPEVNASIDGRDVIYHDYFDIGIAVGSERGLVVPVVRGADKLGTVALEKAIAELAVKAKDGKLSIADMTGGTFTISNGGTYGSLLSTPILNPPQSGILGMHKIQERPVAVFDKDGKNGKVEIRPMMYLALSYDHRLIDGKGAVTFLVHLKDFLEHPEKLKMEY